MVATIVLFVGILPGIFGIATQFPGVEMPLVTRAMMAFSGFLQTHLRSICIGIGLFIFLCSIILSSDSGKAAGFRLALEIP
jgi:type II secretory pathway component PulF